MPALTGKQLRYFASNDKNFFEKISLILTKFSHHRGGCARLASKTGGMIEK
jgi:hypothetical protein